MAKKVRLREGEYRRLMNAARQVNADQAHLQVINRQLTQACKSLQQSQQEAAFRQQALTPSIGSLSGEGGEMGGAPRNTSLMALSVRPLEES